MKLNSTDHYLLSAFDAHVVVLSQDLGIYFLLLNGMFQIHLI
jgi:hypothetical protein